MIKKNSINKAFCLLGQRKISFKSTFLPALIPFLVLILVSSLTSAMKEEDLSTIVKNIRPSIVVVIAYDNENKVLSQGSGFFVSKEGDIVTNRHVIIGASAVEVKTVDGSTYTVNKIISEDVVGDLIKMRIATLASPSRPVIISATLPDVGQKVLVIGSPMGLEQTLSDGIVSSIRQIPSFGNIIQISAPISSGSSGSPVFNLNGEVIGVASYQIASGQNLNFAVPAERLSKLSAGDGKSIADWGKREETTSSKKDWIIEGWLLIVKDEYEKAISCFELAAKENPVNSEPYQLIGDCKSKLGRIDEAIKAYEQAIRLNPDDASAYNGLGWVYIGLKRYAEALDSFKQAIRIYPDYHPHHYGLGYTYGELGRYDESIEAYKQAIR
ncbi:MAG: tetratricopeptide repeat protein, partial [Candidatus Aminicenantes bacterium]